MAERLTAEVWHWPVPAQAKLTLLALSWLADDDTGCARLISPKEIRRITCASRSSTYRAIIFLEERGYITIKRDRHKYHASYTINAQLGEARAA